MWIGTCDGLNIFDGTAPRLYKPANSRIGFSGNIIGNIMETEEDVLWIQTNYGLDRFDSHQQTIQSFKEFKDINKMPREMYISSKMTVTSIISTGATMSSGS